MAQVRLLIRQARIIDSSSPHNGMVMDLLIDNGRITRIAENLSSEQSQVFTAENLHVSQGWIDLGAHLCDPGHEYKEDLRSGLNAAKAGGFTGVVLSPLTSPVVDNKSAVDYLRSRSREDLCEVFPMGTLTEGAEGQSLAELFDMHNHGAVAFTDGKVQTDTAMLVKSLYYARQFDGLVISYPINKSLTQKGQVNESVNSTLTGLKGIPAIAEVIQVQRDLTLLEYTGGKLHFSCISTGKAVELIGEARKKGLKVTCDIAAHQVAFNDTVVTSFDTNFKVNPPFRGTEEVAALLQGLVDGTIDAVCSDHTPEDIENKKVEFDQAAFGIIGLQTSFAITNSQLKKFATLPFIIEKFTDRPRNILGLPKHSIEEGSAANLTFFDPGLKWKLTEDQILSKSKNTPFIEKEFTGKALAVYNRGRFHISA